MENKRIDNFIEMLADLSTFLSSVKFRNAELEQKAKISETVENYLDGFSILRAPMRNVNDTAQLNKGKQEELGITEIFTEKEIKTMPKQIRKLLLIARKRCYVRQHKNSYEIRFRRDGYDVSASGLTIELAKKNFLKKLKTAKPKMKGHSTIPTTFNAFATYYFENFRILKVTAQTYRADISRYNNYLKPAFDERELSRITPLECQSLLREINDTGKGKTADEIYSLLSIIFKGAIKHNVLDKNPLDIIYFEKHERKHGKAFTPQEETIFKSMLATLPDECFKDTATTKIYTSLWINSFDILIFTKFKYCTCFKIFGIGSCTIIFTGN